MKEEIQETLRIENLDSQSIRFGPNSILRRRYRLDREIGRGGMGVVYRATDLELHRQVAIKVLPETASNADSRERFLREARAAAALNHPNIVAVHDVGEEQGIPFFVMELVEGRSLGNAPPTDFRQIVETACQICSALEHAHSQNIVHRDLKPDNVLISGVGISGSIKLADLGVALPVRASRLTNAGSIVGTPAYMSPEQILGKKIDGRADLYALGVLLYELTTGRLPFTGDNPLAIVSQHVHAPVVPPRTLRSDIPRALEAVILKLLSKEPAERYATASDASQALRASLDAGEVKTDDGKAAVAILDALSRGKLIGRADELNEARDLWRRTREGRGHCLLLSGEPGAGKTRLAREITVQAALDGAVVLTGGCYEYEATTPYLPFVEAFRRWVREQPDDERLRSILAESAPQLSKLAPEIEARIGPFTERPTLPPHEERLLFFDAVVHAFTDLAERRGLLFYADDLHWADNSTVWLIGHLLRNLRDARVLIVGAYREIELDRAHPLSKALVDWNRERLMTRIALKRFGAQETRQQLAALLNEPVSSEFAEAVYGETEGNPFFVEEVLKSLIEQGSIRRKSGEWSREEIDDLVIPQSVKEAIGSRLNRVSAECNDILRAAAVLGKTFSFRDLNTVIGDQREDSLLDALDEATTAQLLVAERGDSFTFTHDKIREVLYEELNPIRRRRLHKRTAEGLESNSDRAPVAVETLAHHFIEAGDYERGFQYAKQAGETAEKIFAFDEAIVAYGRALECAESLGLVDEQAELEEKIGNASSASGNQIAACEHYERALMNARDPLQRARLQCAAASALVINGDPRGLDLLRDAFTVLNPETHPIETANALIVEGRFHHLAGRHRQAAELMQQALALAEPKSDQVISVLHAATLISLYTYLAGAHQHMGQFADSNSWARRAIEFGRQHRVPVAEAGGYEFLAENGAYSGDFNEGLRHAKTELEIVATIHSRERRSWAHMAAGYSAWQLKDFDQAHRYFEDCIDLAQAVGDRRLYSMASSYAAALLADTGAIDEALKRAVESAERADATGLLFLRTESKRSLAYVLQKRGELEQAIKLSEEVLDLTSETDAQISRLWIGPPHIEALLALGRKDEAKQRFLAYQEVVADCQAPRFNRKAEALREILAER